MRQYRGFLKNMTIFENEWLSVMNLGVKNETTFRTFCLPPGKN